MSLRRRWFAIGTGLTLFATGCGGGTTGPTTGLSNPEQTIAQLQAADAPLQTQQFQSFSKLSAQFATAFGSPPLATLLQVTRPQVPTPLEPGYTREILRAEAVRTALPAIIGLSQAILPQPVLGKTFVWDGQKYVVDLNRGGAPSSGVRFILYTLSGGLPATPLNEIGYVDLIDKTGPSGTPIVLEIVVVAGGVTYVDYTISGTGNATSASLTVNGFVTDGTARLGFEVSITGSASQTGGTVTFQSTLTVTKQGATLATIVDNFTVSVTPTASGETIAFAVDFRLAADNETVTLGGTITVTVATVNSILTVTTSGSLAVKVNGNNFATISVDASGNPIITGASGQALPQDQKDALDKLFRVPEDILSGLFDLFAPAGDIFGFAFSLPGI